MSTIYTFKNKFVSDILQSDSKLSNLDSGYDYVNEVSFYVIETISEFLVRIAFEFRSPGSVVTMLVPKEGLTPPMKYFSMEEVDAAMANFDIKYYTFKGGMQDINFVEIIGPDIYEEKKNKGAEDGYVGMTLFDINFKNVANTFTSLLRNINTAVRTYVFPDKSGTVALTSDLHPPVTMNPASAAYGDIDPVTQVLTIYEQTGGGGTATTRKYRQVPSGLINDVNAIYTVADLVISGSEEVFRNGQLIDVSGDYSITYGATTTITLTSPLMGASDTAPAEKLLINYSI